LEVLRSTHAALRSGLPLPLALRGALDAASPETRTRIDTLLGPIDLDGDLASALRSSAETADDARVALGLDALALLAGERLAASRAAAVLASVCDRIAFEERLVAEVGARTSGLRVQVLILAGLVPLLALYLVLTVPGLATTLTSELGLRVLVPVAC